MGKKTKLLQWYCKEPFEPFLNSTYEQYIDRPINRGHRVYCGINYMLVLALFTLILLVAYICIYLANHRQNNLYRRK